MLNEMKGRRVDGGSFTILKSFYQSRFGVMVGNCRELVTKLIANVK